MNCIIAGLGFSIPILARMFKRKVQKKGVEAIVLHKNGGKSSLKQYLNNCQTVLFVDLEDSIKKKYKLHDIHSEEFIMKAREHLKELKANFNKKIVLFLSSAALAQDLGLKKKNIHLYLSDPALYKDSIKDITNESMKQEIDTSRNSLIFNKSKKMNVTLFYSFDELKRMVMGLYKINNPF